MTHWRLCQFFCQNLLINRAFTPLVTQQPLKNVFPTFQKGWFSVWNVEFFNGCIKVFSNAISVGFQLFEINNWKLTEIKHWKTVWKQFGLVCVTRVRSNIFIVSFSRECHLYVTVMHAIECWKNHFDKMFGWPYDRKTSYSASTKSNENLLSL